MKFCKDCKHFENALCKSPENVAHGKVDFVTGEQKALKEYARNCREDVLACGPEAEWFEERDA